MSDESDPAATGRLLDLRYEIHAQDSSLAHYLPAALEDSSGPMHDEHTVFELHGTPDTARFHLVIDGEEVTSTQSPRNALSALMWHLNRRTVAATGDRWLFHASVVDLGDRSLALLGASGAGKTTSAVLAARELAGAIVTDDIAALGPDGRWTGAAKPLGLRDGSRATLGVGANHVARPPEPYADGTWYASVTSLGVAVSSSSPVTDIVRLTTDSGSGKPVAERRSTGFAALLESAFDHRRLTSSEASRLADLVRRCRFWAWRPGQARTLNDIVATDPGD